MRRRHTVCFHGRDVLIGSLRSIIRPIVLASRHPSHHPSVKASVPYFIENGIYFIIIAGKPSSNSSRNPADHICFLLRPPYSASGFPSPNHDGPPSTNHLVPRTYSHRRHYVALQHSRPCRRIGMTWFAQDRPQEAPPGRWGASIPFLALFPLL